MKNQLNRLLSLVLCLLLAFVPAVQGETGLPAELTVIGDEAFMGDASLTDVRIPRGVETIGRRAFADSGLKQVRLPASLQAIAGDAFAGCEGLVATVNRDSYAHQYCMDNEIEYIVLEELYSISGLMKEEKQFMVTVSAPENCMVQVDVLDEEQQLVFFSVTAPVEEGQDLNPVYVPYPENAAFPQYFVLRAVLTDDAGKALCAPFLTLQYTGAYEEFETIRPGDYANDVVMDFGDCGFGVAKKGAVSVPGVTRKNAAGNLVLPVTAPPKEGQVIVITHSDGTQEPVKVDRAWTDTDGSVLVTPETDVTLADLYDVFKLDGVGDVGAAAKNGGVAMMQKGDGNITLGSLSAGFSSGPFSVSVSGSAGVVVKTFYNAELFGEDYIEQQLYVQMSVSVSGSVTAEFSSSDIKDAFGNTKELAIPLYNGPVTLVGAGAAVTSLQLEISIPLEFGVDAAGEFTMSLTNKTGYSYTTANGTREIKEQKADYDLEFKGGFHIQAGPRIALEANVLRGLLQGNVSAQIGVRAQGTAKPNDTGATGATVHGCSLCCDIDLSLFAEAKGSVVLKVSKKTKINLLNVTLFSVKASLGKAYLSILNDEDSHFGGKMTFGLGKCPNYKYRVIVRTQGSQGEAMVGIPVTLYKAGTEKAKGPSPLTTHVYDGDYSATAAFDSGSCDQAFTVLRSPMEVIIREKNAGTVAGCITNASTGKAMAGASVTVKDEDYKVVWQGASDGDGKYLTYLLPGDYTLQVSKTGFQTQSLEFGVEASRQTDVNAALSPVTPCGEPVSVFHYNGHTYAVHNCSCTWTQAYDLCRMYGGHLVTFDSPEENGMIAGSLGSSSMNCYWIGLFGSIGNGWGWITGEELTFENWAANEPNNDQQKGEGYVHIFGKKYTGGKGTKYPGDWNDTTNSGAAYASNFYALGNFGFICEWDEIQ